MHVFLSKSIRFFYRNWHRRHLWDINVYHSTAAMELWLDFSNAIAE